MGESTVSDTFGSLNRSHNQLSVVPKDGNSQSKDSKTGLRDEQNIGYLHDFNSSTTYNLILFHFWCQNNNILDNFAYLLKLSFCGLLLNVSKYSSLYQIA